MQTMAGSKMGGAEAFFVRLAVALNSLDISQKIVIRNNADRLHLLRQGGINPVEMGFGGVFDIQSRFTLKREISSFRPNVILSWMSRAARITPACPELYTHIGRLGGYYNLKYFKNCDYLIGNTQDIVDYIIEEGFDSNRVIHLPNFVDPPRNLPMSRADLDTPSDVPLLLAMGRLHKNKAFDTLIESLSLVPKAWLWIAGDGPEATSLSKLANKLGVEDRIRFLGWRNNADALMASADLFICPSRHEPLGNVILEAWAAKKPVIAAAAKGPAELLGNNEYGLLVPIDSPNKLAIGINDLINNPIKASSLAEGGYAAYERKFTKEIVTAQYISFFEKVKR
jgi:glycosyltransferase involved in cell wall biosynthesis